MTASQRFDEFAKSLGDHLPRRVAFCRAGRWLAAIIGGPIGLQALIAGRALADREDNASLRIRIKDAKWKCRSNNVVRVDVDDEGQTGTYVRICLYDVRCTSDGKTEEYIHGCDSQGDRCLHIERCFDEAVPGDKNRVWTTGKLSPETAKQANINRFGTSCRYSWGDPYVLYRKHPEKEVWDNMCASPIEGCAVPQSIKGSFLATCKAVGLIKGEKKNYTVCPPVHDCLAKALPVVTNPPMVDGSKPAKT